MMTQGMKTIFGISALCIACLVIAQCGMFYNKYAGNTKEAKRYKSLLTFPEGKELKNVDVWVSDDSRQIALFFDGKGLPIELIDSSFKVVNEETSHDIVISFLRHNSDVFGELYNQLSYRSMRIDTVEGKRSEIVTYFFNQVYKNIPVFRHGASAARVDAEFSGVSLVALRITAERNINIDPNPTLTFEQALDSLRSYVLGKSIDTAWSYESDYIVKKISEGANALCRSRLIITCDFQGKENPRLVWEIVFDKRYPRFYFVDAHNGELFGLGGSTGTCEDYLTNR